MKPDEQRIAIAKACGWTIEINNDIGSWANGLLCGYDNEGHFILVPEYLNDLNVMYEAEATLANEPIKVLRYYQTLVDLIDHAPDGSHIFGRCIYWESLHASAALRAEAFLKTLNLWTDE